MDCVVVPVGLEHADGLSVQTAPPALAPNLASVAQLAPMSVDTTGELIRSMRQHKPPDRCIEKTKKLKNVAENILLLLLNTF